MTRTFSFGKPNICASTLAHVEDPLRLLVERQLSAIPNCGRGLQLDGVVRLGRRDISLVELDRRAGESAHRHRRARFAGASPGRKVSTTFGIIVGFEVGLDVWFVSSS